MGHSLRRVAIVSGALALALAMLAAPANSATSVSFTRLAGFASPGTPAQYNKVGVLKIGSPQRQERPGAQSRDLGERGLLRAAREDHRQRPRRAGRSGPWSAARTCSRTTRASTRPRRRRSRSSRRFDYYLGYLADSSITPHFQGIPDADVAFAKQWGMHTEIEDLARVVKAARRGGRNVVMGGHSLGGSITSAYATWDFNGRPGAKDLSGLVFIDGGSSPTPVTPEQANQSLQALQSGSPWLTFGGFPAPLAGLFNSTGSLGVRLDPNSPSIGQAFPFLPANLKPPVPVTNIAQYGYALDTATSPTASSRLRRTSGASPRAATRAAGHGPASSTPILRFADMFSGWGLKGLDGTAWYHPQRLTIDSGAVAAGNANPAQDVLDVRATHGSDLQQEPADLRLRRGRWAAGGCSTPRRRWLGPVRNPEPQPDAREPRPRRTPTTTRTPRARKTTS